MEGSCPNCNATLEFDELPKSMRCGKCHAMLKITLDGIADKSLESWTAIFYQMTGKLPLVRGGRIFALIILTFGGVLGSCMLSKDLMKARDTASWPSTLGTITVSQVRQTGASFEPDVKYSYVVNGIKSVGTRLTLRDYGTNDPRSVEKELVGLDVGRTVAVYYDPADPYNAVLLPGAHASNYIPMAMTLLLTIAGLFGLWVMWITSSPKRFVKGIAPLRILDRIL